MWLVFCVMLLSFFPSGLFAQENSAQPKTTTTTCTFQDGQEISLRYVPRPLAKQEQLPVGELWPPSGSPMYLFTQSELSIGNSSVPVGAFSVYVIPEKDNWELVINKAVTAGNPYDQKEDLLRVPMAIGHLSGTPEPFKVVFGHVAPKQCNMRIYAGKVGTWAEFKQK